MDIILAILRIHLISLYNAVCHDRRMGIAVGIGSVISVVSGLWSAEHALAYLHQWQIAGSATLTMGPWSLCWLTWSGMSLVTVVGLPRALSGDETLLLFTLPIPPATRFRALLGTFFIENLWIWLLLQAAVMGYVLLSALGWYALAWFLLLQLGVVAAVCCILLIGLLVMRYLLPRGQFRARIFTFLLLSLLAILLAKFGGQGAALGQGLLLWLRPEFASILLLALLCLLLGPLATVFGRLCEATFLTMQGEERARQALTLPGVHALKDIFERRRTLTAALFAKAVVSQSRNLLSWGRVALLLVLLVLFPLVRTVVVRYGVADNVLVVAYAAGLVIFHIIETAPGAISAEANRLALYLTAPCTLSHILRAKLSLFLLPVLSEGLVIALVLCWRTGLMLGQVAFVVSAVVLMIVGCTTLLVWGSVWDEDLNLAVEGLVETFVQEEVPVTPRKMVLFNACLLLFAFMCLLLWKLPPAAAIVLLILLDACIVIGMWRLSFALLRVSLWKG